MALISNKNKIKGGLSEAMAGSDVFVGLSKANLVTEEMIKSMNNGPIIFAMANPIPEIMPDLALKAGASIVGTGRSDFPNQVNNALAFPGMFRGLFDHGIKLVDQKVSIVAAQAIASCVEPAKNKILPELTQKEIVVKITEAMKGLK